MGPRAARRGWRDDDGSEAQVSFAHFVLLARLAVAEEFDPRDVPEPSIVLAIIEHETRGNATLCVNEADGSSSRGLMQRNRKHSRCCAEDDARFAADYDPRKSIAHGVWLLAFQAAWHRTKGHTGHDCLEHYAGRGPLAVKFARDVRALAATIAARGEG